MVDVLTELNLFSLNQPFKKYYHEARNIIQTSWFVTFMQNIIEESIRKVKILEPPVTSNIVNSCPSMFTQNIVTIDFHPKFPPF